MKRPLFILGTRPEVIKLSPLFAALRDKNLKPRILSTGQHRDLVPQALAAFDLKIDIDLDLMNPNQAPLSFVDLAEKEIAMRISKADTSYIIVQGDTASSLAGARVGKKLNIPVGHVEAGIRSHNIDEPWPEEGFRMEIAQIATHHFAPTKQSQQNLLREEIALEKILVTGNTVIDAIHSVRSSPKKNPEKTILLSLHRRENITTHATEMKIILAALVEQYQDYTFRVIEHPNPESKSLLRSAFCDAKNIVWEAPMDYPKVIEALQEVSLVVTDSGGFQEEAAELKTPIVVLREHTDRPESLGKGAFLAKRDLDLCLAAVQQGLALTSFPENPFGKVGASESIANFIQSYFEENA